MPVSRNLCIFLNVGLGEAAKRDVGTGAGQIPDMSAWSLPSGGVGMPNGIHFRYGYVTVTGDKVFSTPFPNQCFGIVFGQTYLNNDWLFGPAFLENSVNKNGFTFMDIAWSGNSGDFVIKAGERVFYIAIGN
ncbi:phage tail protein [Escherichia coli]|nr:phage tail protein [Escherichia coli]GCR74781.1 phage tail protein [Escherichia coli]